MVKCLRILATIVAIFSFNIGVNAQTAVYMGKLIVNVYGINSEPQDASVEVKTSDDGTIKLTLRNLIIATSDSETPIGNISVKNIIVESENGIKSFSYEGETSISTGNKQNIEQWEGPAMGNVPVVLKGIIDKAGIHFEMAVTLSGTINNTIKIFFGKKLTSMKSFTDNLIVNVNGENSIPIYETIDVTYDSDNTIDVFLDNFILHTEEGDKPIGNISVRTMMVKDSLGCQYFSRKGNIEITAGSTDNIADDQWIGPQLGEIPIRLKAFVNEEKIYITIEITMTNPDKKVLVYFGNDITNEITNVYSPSTNSTEIYSVNGTRVSKEHKGIQIIRTSDGRAKKILNY
ncbi:MAG: calycin-like domain-containing protein [Bacteroidaceae bacterium]|nr:calycin-like domain-containing protein [Bacteroidaceae bacterium]